MLSKRGEDNVNIKKLEGSIKNVVANVGIKIIICRMFQLSTESKIKNIRLKPVLFSPNGPG